MLEIECPQCGEIGKISFIDKMYNDPYRCWKCRQTYIIEVEESVLKSITPMSAEDFEKWQEEQKRLKE
jgi:hypothetical protein